MPLLYTKTELSHETTYDFKQGTYFAFIFILVYAINYWGYIPEEYALTVLLVQFVVGLYSAYELRKVINEIIKFKGQKKIHTTGQPLSFRNSLKVMIKN